MRLARKRELNLKRRQDDFDKMIAKMTNTKGYHKPGSNKKGCKG